MAEPRWSQTLPFPLGPEGLARAVPLLASPPPWRTCEAPPTTAAVLDADDDFARNEDMA
jgi:hypothetical protein